MYISKSSELKYISCIDNPLLEAGFTNSLKVCLKYREPVKKMIVKEKNHTRNQSQASTCLIDLDPLGSHGKGLCWKSTFDCRSTNK
jgi:hypothetical protein